MPDRRTHRGPHPEDAVLFTTETLPVLRQAVGDMSLLLSRGYAEKSSLKLVGDRYALNQRQRTAVMRSSCSDEKLHQRQNSQIQPESVSQELGILDGYNILITVEAALAGGVLLLGRDGCIRDLASIHGTYRKVSETLPALEVISEILIKLNPSEVVWVLDKPVSNSGRLKGVILEFAAKKSLRWDVRLEMNPDKVLLESEHIIATSDSAVLDGCEKWLNLARIVVENLTANRNINLLDLRGISLSNNVN
mgnify:CR=1 FL=1